MTDTNTDTGTTPRRGLWHERAVEAAATIADRGKEITLGSRDYPSPPAVIVRLGDTTPHVFATYRKAAEAMRAWAQVL